MALSLALVQDVVFTLSGEQILFNAPGEVVPIVARCGLTPLLVEVVTS
jgi:hypothetical protein